jgi:DNA-binding NarL/FixJ family response regulator
MILMLVKDESPWTAELGRQLAPYGVTLVHYRHPLKAMDNFEEVRPQIVLYDLQDFPRHWKILVKYLREEYTKEQVVFLLVSRGPAPLEEANKALYLGVNGILQDNGDPTVLARNIREIFLRYGTFEVDQHPEAADADGSEPGPLAFLFRHPRRKHLVTGVLVKFDGTRATFKPDFAHEVADLSEGDCLTGGSLRMAENLVTVDATITKNNGQLLLSIETKEG